MGNEANLRADEESAAALEDLLPTALSAKIDTFFVAAIAVHSFVKPRDGFAVDLELMAGDDKPPAGEITTEGRTPVVVILDNLITASLCSRQDARVTGPVSSVRANRARDRCINGSHYSHFEI